MRARFLSIPLLLAGIWLAPAHAAPWTPSTAGPSRAARLVLDSLPDPSSVPLPPDLPRTAPPAPAPSEGGTSPLPTGGCYEVQLYATGDATAARRQADTAASALGAPTHIVGGGGLYRVRAGSCLEAQAAASLRDRARERGYPGAFVTPGAPERSGS